MDRTEVMAAIEVIEGRRAGRDLTAYELGQLAQLYTELDRLNEEPLIELDD